MGTFLSGEHLGFGWVLDTGGSLARGDFGYFGVSLGFVLGYELKAYHFWGWETWVGYSFIRPKTQGLDWV